jgi:PAS domain S-box-containing protein
VEAILDITDRKVLEKQLMESEEKYRKLVELSLDGIALFQNFQLFFANTQFAAIFGFRNPLEMVDLDLLKLVAPESKRQVLEQVLAAEKESAPPQVMEAKGLRQDQSLFDMEVMAFSIVYKGGRVVQTTVRDISQRKKMEEHLIRSERLTATGKLAFDIAHEINNPLGGILTYSHLMMEDFPQDEKNRQNLEKIIKLANRCKIIVRGLLDFAREEPTGREWVDVNQILKETLLLLERHVLFKKITFVREWDPGLPLLSAERTKLEQVFMNMIINAAEAMEGEGLITLRTRREEDPPEILISIRDTGPGISEEQTRRIFEPFYTTKIRGRGTGLGLSISHGIIKQHQGTIEVESTPGEGACFNIRLPLSQA